MAGRFAVEPAPATATATPTSGERGDDRDDDVQGEPGPHGDSFRRLLLTTVYPRGAVRATLRRRPSGRVTSASARIRSIPGRTRPSPTPSVSLAALSRPCSERSESASACRNGRSLDEAPAVQDVADHGRRLQIGEADVVRWRCPSTGCRCRWRRPAARAGCRLATSSFSGVQSRPPSTAVARPSMRKVGACSVFANHCPVYAWVSSCESMSGIQSPVPSSDGPRTPTSRMRQGPRRSRGPALEKKRMRSSSGPPPSEALRSSSGRVHRHEHLLVGLDADEAQPLGRGAGGRRRASRHGPCEVRSAMTSTPSPLDRDGVVEGHEELALDALWRDCRPTATTLPSRHSSSRTRSPPTRSSGPVRARLPAGEHVEAARHGADGPGREGEGGPGQRREVPEERARGRGGRACRRRAGRRGRRRGRRPAAPRPRG